MGLTTTITISGLVQERRNPIANALDYIFLALIHRYNQSKIVPCAYVMGYAIKVQIVLGGVAVAMEILLGPWTICFPNAGVAKCMGGGGIVCPTGFVHISLITMLLHEPRAVSNHHKADNSVLRLASKMDSPQKEPVTWKAFHEEWKSGVTLTWQIVDSYTHSRGVKGCHYFTLDYPVIVAISV